MPERSEITRESSPLSAGLSSHASPLASPPSGNAARVQLKQALPTTPGFDAQMQMLSPAAPRSSASSARASTTDAPDRSGDHDTASPFNKHSPKKEDPRDVNHIHNAAEAGLSGGGGTLPFADRIQQSFGSFDVSGVRAHTGTAAENANKNMRLMAHASSNDVVFGGAPDLFTAAHEAAHIIQQQAGVQLRGGVGEVGDPYEQHADAVASRVVQGESAEDLLRQFTKQPNKTPIQQQSQTQPGIQKRSPATRQGGVQLRRPIQRRTFPSGSTTTMVNTAGDTAPIYAALRQLCQRVYGWGMDGKAVPDFEGEIQAKLELALSSHGRHSFPFEFTETRGFNTIWQGSVAVEIGEPIAGPARNTSVNTTANAGRSDQHSSSESQKDTTSLGAAGGTGSTGGPHGSVTVGASHEEQASEGSQATSSSGDTTSGELQNTSQNMSAVMRARVSLEAEPEMEGLDYLNPFKLLAQGGADLLTNNGRQSMTVNCGTVTWVQRNGLR